MVWIFMAISLFADVVTADAAGRPLDQKEIKAIAGMSLTSQRSSNTQEKLQQWFIYKVSQFQGSLNDTFLGKSHVINLGDFSSQYRRFLSPPTGTGTFNILWDSVASPQTLDDIKFPNDAAGINKYSDNTVMNTFWHEFQHVIMMNETLLVNVRDWDRYRKPPSDDFAEHVYMESLAEYTTEWLDYLLHVLKFEKLILKAYKESRQNESRSIPFSYALEYHTWSRVFEAWQLAFKSVKRIAPLPKVLREDYKNYTGIVIPFVEEIVQFYMKGGVKAPDGHLIRVPEWTMWIEPMKCPVILDHLNESREIKNDTLSYGFEIKLVERYKPTASSASRAKFLNHGSLIVSVDRLDPETRVAVSFSGQTLTATQKSPQCVVDLAKIDPKKGCRLTLTRAGLSSYSGVKTYRIEVHFKDEPRIEKGVKKPSFYYEEKAYYDVSVQGTRKVSSATPVPALGNQSTLSTDTSTSKGMWVLKKTWTEKHVDSMSIGQPHRYEQTIERNKATTSAYFKVSGKEPPQVVKSLHAWTDPGTRIEPGTLLEMTLTVENNGSQNMKPAGLSHSTRIKAWRKSATSHGYSLRFSDGKGSSAIDAGLPGSKASRSMKVHIPTGKMGDTIQFEIEALGEMVSSKSIFLYEFNATSEKTSSDNADALVQLVAKEPTPKPLEPPMDNEPPEPGDIVVIKPLPVTPPQPARPRRVAEKWYVHPKGDYRIALPKLWDWDKDSSDQETDVLSPADDSAVIFCGRGVGDIAKKSEKQALIDLARSFAADASNTTTQFIKIGTAQSVLLEQYNQEEDQMLWHLYVAHKGRSYYMGIALPPGSGKTVCPQNVMGMINGLQFLR